MIHTSGMYRLPVFAESWNVAFRKRRAEGLKDRGHAFSVIPNSCRYWAADPFLFEYNGESFVFAELYDYFRRRGIIGFCKLNENKPRWNPIIAEDYHLSYPCVFLENGQIYLMPEASESKSLYRYRAVRFPDVWEKEEILRSDVSYVDTTPFRINGRSHALAYDLNGPALVLLCQNQDQDRRFVCPNMELRRPAGRIDEESMIRPAQISIHDYGEGIIFYQVDLDDTLNYSEHELFRVLPEDLVFSPGMYLEGMHTYNASEHYEVVDIKTRRLNLLNLSMRVWNHFERFWRKTVYGRKRGQNLDHRPGL